MCLVWRAGRGDRDHGGWEGGCGRDGAESGVNRVWAGGLGVLGADWAARARLCAISGAASCRLSVM